MPQIEVVTYKHEAHREHGIAERLADGWEWVIPDDDKPLTVRYRRWV